MTLEELREISNDTPERRRVSHEEHNSQVACVNWFNWQYPQYRGMLFAVPNGAMLNGTAKQRMLAGKRLRDEGMVKGVADLILLIPNKRYHGLCIEMKTARGTQSAAQKEWGEKVEVFGFHYVVVKPKKSIETLDLFIREVNAYLRNR